MIARRRRRPRVAALLATVLLVAAGLAASPAAAVDHGGDRAGSAPDTLPVQLSQEETPPEEAVSLVPMAISAIVGPDEVPGARTDLTLRLLVSNGGGAPVGELRVFVEVFAAVSSRSELHSALDGRSPTVPLLVDMVTDVRDGDPLSPGGVQTLEIVVDSDRVGWPSAGVHPVRISVLHGRQVLDEVVTGVVRLASAPEVPLQTVLGWPLAAAPVTDAEDAAALLDEVQPGGRLERHLWALERNPDARVQPLISAHLLEDLVALDDPRASAFLDRLREALGRLPPPVVGPYADADLAGLVAHGLPLEALQHVLESRRVAEQVLERRPVPDALWATTPLSPATARDLLVPARVRTVLLDWSQLDLDPRPPRTPDTPYALAPGGGALVALATDPWFLGLLPDPTVPPAVAVQRVVAETALIHLERPNAPDRTLTLLPPAYWAARPSVVDGLLEALDRAPWLEINGIGAALDQAAQPYPPARLHAAETSITGATAAAISSARRDLVALQDALREPGAGVGGATWQEMDRSLLRAASASAGARTADDIVTQVRAAIAEGLGTVQLPTGSQITLTDVDGTIPVTVTRREGPAIRVTVSLDAPPRLQFPEGATRTFTLEEGERRTISFETTAAATGRIPVIARATIADGPDALLLAEEQVVVNSVAVSRTALATLGGVFALLFIWWLVRRVRPAAPRLEVVRDDAA